MKPSKLRSILGESFLILCNLLITVTSEEFDYELINRSVMPLDKTSYNPLIIVENEIQVLTSRNEKSLSYYLPVNEKEEIGFLVTPCETVNISWTVSFRPNLTDIRDANVTSTDVLLAHYQSSVQESYIGQNVSGGLYTLEIETENQVMNYRMFVTKNAKTLEIMKQMKINDQRRIIKFRKNINSTTLNFHWSKVDVDSSKLRYLVIINSRKFYSSACQFELDEDDDSEYVVTKNNSYSVKKVELGAMYYCSIFVTEDKKYFIPYLFSKARFFPALKDGKPMRENLWENGIGKLTYRYKVRRHRFPDSINSLMWYVIPCQGTINIQVSYKKKIIVTKHSISKYENFVIPQPVEGGRYVINIYSTSSQPLSDQAIEVFVTMRPKYFLLPNVTNTSLRPHSIMRNSLSISWWAAANDEPIEYCVHVRKVKEDYSKLMMFNQCNVETDLRKIKNKYCQFSSDVQTRENKIVTQILNKLDPTRNYLVFVTAGKKNVRRKVWYDVMKIDGKMTLG